MTAYPPEARQWVVGMGDYSRRGEEALTSFMAKVAARGDALGATRSRLQRRRGSINFAVFLPTALFPRRQLRPWRSGLWRTASRTTGKLRPPIALVKSGPAA
jgi:hypothetical protein